MYFCVFKSKQWNACGFCVFNKYNQTNGEFRELFDQLFSETVTEEYIDFDIEVVISLSPIDPLIVAWRQETSNKNVAEVIEMSNAAVAEANQSEEEPEIVTDEDENRKITATEALEVNRSDHLNMIFYELIENVEQMKLKNRKQSDIRSFFRS